MENNKQSKMAKVLLGAAIVASLGTGLIGVASADSTVASNAASAVTQRPADGSRGVAGTVVSVSGNTITLTGKDGKTYTIDAASAKISKVETITTANIAAGDTLEIGGTVSGTSVAAKNIIDGQLPAGGGFGGPRGGEGQGRPAVMGTVSAISGTTLTIADKSGTSYTVDAASATVLKGGTQGVKPTTSTLSAIAVGDTIGVRGTISGTTATATEIFDGILPTHQENGSRPSTTQESAE